MTSLIIGCVQTTDPSAPLRIDYEFNVDDVGTTLYAGQDSILVSEFKLLAEKFQVITSDNATLETQVGALIMSYRTQNNGEDELVFSASIGYDDFQLFKRLELFIDRATDGEAIRDPDFIGQESNYSIIIKGSMNGEEFEYKSGAQFDKSLPFEEVEISEARETLVLRVLSDIDKVLIDPTSGSILDPTDPANRTTIDSLVQVSLNVEALAEKRFF